MSHRIRGLEASRREFLWSTSLLVGASVIATGLLDVTAAMAAGEIKVSVVRMNGTAAAVG